MKWRAFELLVWAIALGVWATNAADDLGAGQYNGFIFSALIALLCVVEVWANYAALTQEEGT